jgi:hypothetical protein
MALEEARTERAEALHATHLAARAVAAWKLVMALMHRKRVLSKAAKQLCDTWSLCKGLQRWMVFAYYKHMGHVALHFRIRRLGCVVMRAWHQVGDECCGGQYCCCMSVRVRLERLHHSPELL